MARPNFMEKTFAGGSNNAKIVNVFSLKSFPLYRNTHESHNHSHTLTNRIHVVAGEEPHYDVQVRLVNTATNNSFNYEGRVEVLHRGLWGTICNEQWTINDAHVICRYVRP